ncbi:MAG: peptide chain release factor N(5)-glutamine methyltransferase [Pseudanabaenaceae cyanobacterium SKYGB_i_bin29]|nr:peptide chain release factor N(5)-glutamine methyltransferase [Pseudanabaenaceae cyanobacterium SKYG29]MDW8421896.1 peptide chain release factor N(5)-glutamine methyltransferase [Pseudanabaenaceae cyanobacterium SKYGB_i_bin29]
MLDFWQWYDRARSGRTAELDWLILALTPLTKLDLRLRSPRFADYDWQYLDQLWQRHVQEGIPVQYLAGQTLWRDLLLTVNEAVLIPRPETELIIEIVAASTEPQGVWCDLGTGSGAIAIALARTFPAITVLAVDISEAALQVAQANIDRYGLGERVKCVQGSWFSSLTPGLAGMVSNPPYIPSDMIPTLAREVQREPRLALDGGADGLQAIRHLVAAGKTYLKEGGFWLVEVMAGASGASSTEQAQTVADMLQQNDYRSVTIHKDWQGNDRFVSGFVG